MRVTRFRNILDIIKQTGFKLVEDEPLLYSKEQESGVKIFFQNDADTDNYTIWYFSFLSRRERILYQGLIPDVNFCASLLINLGLNNLM